VVPSTGSPKQLLEIIWVALLQLDEDVVEATVILGALEVLPLQTQAGRNIDIGLRKVSRRVPKYIQ
jgi:hypothetical protein